MKRIVKVLIVLLVILIGIILYARFIGTASFITKEYAVYNPTTPTSFDGMKIVHFSDLHYNQAITNDKIKKIVNEINLIDPDIVVFTGDLIDELSILTDKDYEFLEQVLSKINAKYGKYAIMGNHDKKYFEKISEVYQNSNFIYLENNYETIYGKTGEKINIFGLGNVTYGLDDTTKMFDGVNLSEGFNIVLVHEPDIVDEIVYKYNVSLVLGGHSHNGQIRLPFIGAIYTPEGAKKYYDEYYRVNDTDLYISSGIGVSLLNYRLFNRPSINFYRINKGEYCNES